MEIKWETMEIDDWDPWNFYGAAKWIVKKYLNKIIIPEQEYSYDEILEMEENLIELIDEDMLNEINIYILTSSSLENFDLEWVFYVISEGLSKGMFTLEDLGNNSYLVSRYILLKEVPSAFSERFSYLFRSGEKVKGIKLLEEIN